MLRVGILGCRGIPNRYGGFEQFAEHLSLYLVRRGHQVTVYQSSLHPYKEKTYQGVELIRCYDPENKVGTAGQFVYDLLSILDSRQRSFDVLLQLGYTSSSLWFPLHPAGVPLLTNMDGLEWKRSKYGPSVRNFLRWAEGRAARLGGTLIADSLGIQDYLLETYGRPSVFIPYGATVRPAMEEEAAHTVLRASGLQPGAFYLVLARMEPDNHIHTLLEGYTLALQARPDLPPLALVGQVSNRFARELRQRYPDGAAVRWLGGIYEQSHVEALRQHCAVYFHGHSVGGTNPSLLEAMASGCRIIAHHNIFNQSVLGTRGLYFQDAAQLARLLSHPLPFDPAWPDQNRTLIREQYAPDLVASAYEQLMHQCVTGLPG
jgi:glycosyltransferase involved in cell wall biosynthesis